MSRRGLRLLGGVLVAYGLTGAVLLVLIGMTIAQPLDEISRLTSALNEQRDAALDSLERASETIGQTTASVRNMETSLVQAALATERAAGISRGVGQTMRNLAARMSLTVLGVQPLIGLQASFEHSGEQLNLLANDVAAIGNALDSNRDDALAVAEGLDELGRSIDNLRVAVAASPNLETGAAMLEPLRLGMLALVGWLLLAAVACVGGGVACWRLGDRISRPQTASIVE